MILWIKIGLALLLTGIALVAVEDEPWWTRITAWAIAVIFMFLIGWKIAGRLGV